MQLSIVTGQHTYQIKPTLKEPQKAALPNKPESTKEQFIRVDQNAIAQLDTQFQNANRQAIYDQPSFRNAKAIDSYKTIANEERRNEIQSLIGVSLFA